MKTRKGLGIGMGMGYKNLVPLDPYIHSLSAKGIGTKVFPLTRVPYGRKDTPKAKREYKHQLGSSPVGTIKEWKDFAKKSGVDKLHINENDGTDFYVDVDAKGKTKLKYGIATKGIGDEKYPIKFGFETEEQAMNWAKKEFGNMRGLRVISGFGAKGKNILTDRKEIQVEILAEEKKWIYSLKDEDIPTKIWDYYDIKFWEEYYDFDEKYNATPKKGLTKKDFDGIRESYLDQMWGYILDDSDDDLKQRYNMHFPNKEILKEIELDAKGQKVTDWTTGRKGKVRNEGYSWTDVEWEDGTVERDVPKWKLDAKRDFGDGGGLEYGKKLQKIKDWNKRNKDIYEEGLKMLEQDVPVKKVGKIVQKKLKENKIDFSLDAKSTSLVVSPAEDVTYHKGMWQTVFDAEHPKPMTNSEKQKLMEESTMLKKKIKNLLYDVNTFKKEKAKDHELLTITVLKDKFRHFNFLKSHTDWDATGYFKEKILDMKFDKENNVVMEIEYLDTKNEKVGKELIKSFNRLNDIEIGELFLYVRSQPLEETSLPLEEWRKVKRRMKKRK